MSTELVPVTEVPLLSPALEPVLGRMALRYLETVTVNGLGVNFNPKTFQQAQGVMLDCYLRGVRSTGIVGTEKELKKAVWAGEKAREAVIQQATQIIEDSLALPSYSNLVGPWAISREMIYRVRDELRGANLTPNLIVSEDLIKDIRARQPFLKEWSALSLASLPTSLDIGVDKFPDPKDQARLIRNLILSFIFRGDLSPLLSVEETRKFSQQVQEESLFWGPEAKESLITRLEAKESVATQYLGDLFEQTTSTLAKLANLPEDLSYQPLAAAFLLLNPLLEEQQLITRVDNYDGKTPSIWDDGESWAGYRFPGISGLLRAARQAKARNDNSGADRLFQGARLLRLGAESRRLMIQKRSRILSTLTQQESLLNQAMDPSIPLPKDAYRQIYVSQTQFDQEIRQKEREIVFFRETIEEADGLNKRADAYEQFLITNYGPKWPKMVPMERAELFRQGRERVKRWQKNLAAAKKQLTIFEGLLDANYFWAKSHEKWPPFTLGEAGDWLKGRIAKEKDNLQIMEKEYQPPRQCRPFLASLVRYYQPLAGLLYGQRKEGSFEQRYLTHWLNVYQKAADFLERSSSSDNGVKLWEEIYRSSSYLELRYFEHALNLWRSAQVTESKRKEVEEEFVGQEGKEELLEKAVWSSFDAAQFIQKLRASVLSPQALSSLRGQEEMVKRVYGFVIHLPVGSLPRVIYDRFWLQNWLGKSRSKIVEALDEQENTEFEKEEILEGKTPARLQRFDQELQQMSMLINNPLTPFPEGDGLERNYFLEAWRKRATLAYVAGQLPEAVFERNNLERFYDLHTRKLYQEKLEKLILSLKTELTALDAGKEGKNKELIKRMEGLGLLLAVDS